MFYASVLDDCVPRPEVLWVLLLAVRLGWGGRGEQCGCVSAGVVPSSRGPHALTAGGLEYRQHRSSKNGGGIVRWAKVEEVLWVDRWVLWRAKGQRWTEEKVSHVEAVKVRRRWKRGGWRGGEQEKGRTRRGREEEKDQSVDRRHEADNWFES